MLKRRGGARRRKQRAKAAGCSAPGERELHGDEVVLDGVPALVDAAERALAELRAQHVARLTGRGAVARELRELRLLEQLAVLEGEGPASGCLLLVRHRGHDLGLDVGRAQRHPADVDHAAAAAERRARDSRRGDMLRLLRLWRHGRWSARVEPSRVSLLLPRARDLGCGGGGPPPLARLRHVGRGHQAR